MVCFSYRYMYQHMQTIDSKLTDAENEIEQFSPGLFVLTFC